MAAIKPILYLDYPRKDGSTLRQHYTQIKQWDWIEENSPNIPIGGEYLWEWFWEIIGGKGGEEGFWSCLRAWSEMTKIRPTMWEVDALQRLHREYSKEVGLKMREK
jgi:hypothetical protein